MNSKGFLQYLIYMVFCVLLAAPVLGQADAEDDKPPTQEPESARRDYLHREQLEQARFSPSPEQLAAVNTLAAEVSELAVAYDLATGVTRTLYNRAGYLTGPSAQDADPVALAMDFVSGNLGLLGLQAGDLTGLVVRDNVFSAVSGATHVYFGQNHLDLPVYNAMLHVNVNRTGRLISVNNTFMPAAAASANSATPSLNAADAASAAADHLGIGLSDYPVAVKEQLGDNFITVKAPQLSKQRLQARNMWFPVQKDNLRLVWNFQVYTRDDQHIYDINVDAHDGTVWSRIDWVAADDYNVYAHPIESPNFATPPPPSDARTVEIDPADTDASPFGWHDTDGVAGGEFTITRGNNVHAYDDSSNQNAPNAAVPEPDGGAGLSFDEPMDQLMDPQTYRDAATVELFYWNNIIHDILWHYGFDEAGGNFQVNNYGRGGLGNDDVRAESQDGSGTNNANFGTPPDGSRPRMQMYRFTITSPGRDGDFDHGIVIHEYGHGISNRLIGGPSNVSCLSGSQQPGEGISDWYWLAMTHQAGLTGETPRGAGTYVLGQPVDGAGVRPQRYSTDPAINSYTYETINTGVSVPHGVGSVWANAAYEVYWALVNQHGFDPDMYNPSGAAGNHRALLYFTEGMKNSICGPDFLEVRDGVIQAAIDNFSGEDVCTVWQAFADFGLGEDALSPGAGSLSVTNGFNIPSSCNCQVPAAPTDLVVSCNGLSVALSWDGSADRYNVYRAAGTCAGASYTQIATGVSGTGYIDTSATVGATYSYVVRGTPESGLCESSDSNCDEVVLACDTLLNMAPDWAACFNILNMLGCNPPKLSEN